MKIRINFNLQCEVDQVWLNPVYIESGHSLDRNEIDDVLSVVNAHRYELEQEYRYNAEYGADY